VAGDSIIAGNHNLSPALDVENGLTAILPNSPSGGLPTAHGMSILREGPVVKWARQGGILLPLPYAIQHYKFRYSRSRFYYAKMPANETPTPST
jgi:hypothetical protein